MPLNRIPSFGQQEKGGSHPFTASMPKQFMGYKTSVTPLNTYEHLSSYVNI